MIPTLCSVLELWRKRGKELFYEAQPDEAREFIKVLYHVEYTKEDYLKPGYISWGERSEEQYETWVERRKSKGLSVPMPPA